MSLGSGGAKTPIIQSAPGLALSARVAARREGFTLRYPNTVRSELILTPDSCSITPTVILKVIPLAVLNEAADNQFRLCLEKNQD
jgi:hypothetical protein